MWVNGGRIVIEVSETAGAGGSWVSPLEVLDVGNAVRELNGDGTETVVVPFRAGAGGFAGLRPGAVGESGASVSLRGTFFPL